ncbi:MAG: hypothetical protein IPM15_18365 [Betaproteobacteria bacterium]|nr:hypothetical protein [Betaproteobacteria bacterium]
MIVIALLAIIAILAAPSFTEMIGMQRLRGINDQLATDFQYLRTEAVSRNQFMGFVARSVSAEPVACYTIFSSRTIRWTLSSIDRIGVQLHQRRRRGLLEPAARVAHGADPAQSEHRPAVPSQPGGPHDRQPHQRRHLDQAAQLGAVHRSRVLRRGPAHPTRAPAHEHQPGRTHVAVFARWIGPGRAGVPRVRRHPEELPAATS